MEHLFTTTPELRATGKGVDNRLITAQRITCSCGASWIFRTEASASRVLDAHLSRVNA